VSRPPSKRAHSVVRDPCSIGRYEAVGRGVKQLSFGQIECVPAIAGEGSLSKARPDWAPRHRPPDAAPRRTLRQPDGGVNAVDRSARNEFEGAALSVLQLGLTFKSRQPQRKHRAPVIRLSGRQAAGAAPALPSSSISCAKRRPTPNAQCETATRLCQILCQGDPCVNGIGERQRRLFSTECRGSNLDGGRRSSRRDFARVRQLSWLGVARATPL
jgi:hypothetical protein